MHLVLREKGCTACDGPVTRSGFTQLPLLLHAGYGEARHHELEHCTTPGCGQVREVAVSARNPRAVLRGDPVG